jgi:outer membrane murein-binding lipoprotein Lpp
VTAVDVSAIKAAFDTASLYSEFATIAVTIGVFIEFVALFIFGHEMPAAEKGAMIFATFLIVAGCAGEFIFGSRANTAASQLQQASDEKIASLEHDSKRLFDDAASAKRDTAKALADAAIAERGAAEAKLALEEYRAPRSLQNAPFLVAKLKEFSGQEYKVTTYWDEKEPLAFANQLYVILQQAGWSFIKPQSASFLLGGQEGVQVWVHPAADEKARRAAEALVSAFERSQSRSCRSA